MLRPVGDLPASVYWRRRLAVLALVLVLLAGVGWLVAALVDRAGADTAPAGGTGASGSPAPTPGLEQVVPSLAGVRTPHPRPAMPTPVTGGTGAAPTPAGPVPGGRCTDAMVEVAIRAPAEVQAGSKPTLEIVVRNVATSPCVLSVDQELQEIVLVSDAGTRVWGSNDCFPEESDRSVPLRPGASVALPIVWGGLTSAPGCADERVVPPVGTYALRARLDTKTSADRPIRLT